MKGRLSRADLRALALLCLLLGVLFNPVLFRGQAFYERDILFDAYTSADSLVASITRGSWPLWDNAIAFGQPLLAYPNSGVLYPATWLNLLVRPSVGYTVFAVGHALIAGLGAYLLGRRLGASREGAFLTGGLWVTCGPFLSLLNVYHFAGAAWIPWIWWAAEGAFRSRTWRAGTVLGGLGALQILAGSPEMCAIAQCLVVAALVVHVRPPATRGGVLAAFAGGTALAAGLAAAQWLPTLAITLASPRMALPEQARTTWSVPPGGLVQLLLPVPFQSLDFRPPYPRLLPPDASPFLASLYLGLAALPLVVAALTVLRPARLLQGSLLIGSLIFSLGNATPFYGWTLKVVPLLGLFRYPSKAAVLAAMLWAVLAGAGLDTWRAARAPGPRRVVLSVGAASVLAAALVLAAGVRLAPARLAALPADWGTLVARLWIPVLAAALGLLLLRRSGRRWRRGLVALILADLVAAHAGLNRTAPAALLDFKPPFVDALRQEDHRRAFVFEYAYLPDVVVQGLLGHTDRYRLAVPSGLSLPMAQVLSLRLYPYPPSAARWGIEGSFDMDERGLYRPELARLTGFAYALAENPALVRLLRVGAVGRVVALHSRGLEGLPLRTSLSALFPEPVRVYDVPGALPRTYAVGAARAVPDDDQALGLLSGEAFDPGREVLVPGLSLGDPARPFHGTSRILTLDPDHVVLDAELDQEGVVVLVDTYDPGWQVRLDGRPAPLLRANVAFRGVRVPAGRHRIEMRYRPPSVVAGVGLSLVAGLAALAGLRRGRAGGG